jgi:CubicO group peptidase (beta-lactamase class C family)
MNGGIVSSPERVGIDRLSLELAVQHLERLRKEGMHRGAQMFVARHGIPVLDVAIGEARQGVPLNVSSVMLWFSSTKPFTSVAIAQQVERGLLSLDDPVKKYIPEFGNGKESCTVRHILTHTGGFRMQSFPFLKYDWPTSIQKICQEPAEWEPGTQAGYHPLSGWNILGEIIRKVDGRPIETYLKEELFMPLGMEETHLNLTPEQVHSLSGSLSEAIDNTTGKPDSMEDSRSLGRILPGGGGRGPAHDLAKLYLMLSNEGEWDGHRFLKKETVSLFTSVQRSGIIDRTVVETEHIEIKPPWGLGFMKVSQPQEPHVFGSHATSAAYGHSGHGSSFGMVEPTRDLVVVCVTNGIVSEMENIYRFGTLSDLIHQSCR